MNYNIKNVVENFKIDGKYLSHEPYGAGHINDTFAVTFADNKSNGNFRMIVQRVNHNIFKDVPGLMQNISGVTDFLRDKIKSRGGNPDRETLTVIRALDDKPYFVDGDGNFWRVYIFVEDTLTLQQAENDEDFYNCGASFGKFIGDLADYPAADLHETIPNFHHTGKRFENLKNAITADKMGRAKDVQAEIEFALAREKDASFLTDKIDSGYLPLRVTHNDTKLNNILMDPATRKGVCVIDLDTVMPGLALYDFGDSIRFGASTAAEDETDLSKVMFDLNLYEVYAKGFLDESKSQLTPLEIELMPWGAKLMTFECGIRFLTDYLEGDTYFKIHREHHNLDRCRTQFKLVSEMEKVWDEMAAVITKI